MVARKKKKRGGGFQYTRRSQAEVDKRTQVQSSFDSFISNPDVASWIPKEGRNTVRILPPTWEDADHYAYDVWIHYQVGPDSGSYLCPAKMNNEKCAVCDHRKGLINAGQGDSDEVKQLRPGPGLAAYVLVRGNGDDVPDGVAMWRIPPSKVDVDIVEAMRNGGEGGSYLDIDDPYDGYDVIFKRTGKGQRTDYKGVSVARHSSPALDDEDELEEILAFIKENPVPDVLKFYDYEYVQGQLGGIVDLSDDEEDDDYDDEGSTRSSRRGSRKSSRRRDDEEDEEDDDDAPLDDEDEDDYEDEEEEDTKPPKSRGSRSRSSRSSTRGKSKRGRRSSLSDEDDDDDDEPSSRRRRRR